MLDTRSQHLTTRLSSGPPLLLDGATGTELGRRGVDLSPPLWSAHALLEAPDVLRQVHAEYAAAGAEAVTANTFRTHSRSLSPAGLADRAAELTRLAVQLARDAVPSDVFVFGSQAPLEDCYSPHLVPDEQTLQREHAQMAANLAAAGVDAILVETQNCMREAVAAVQAAVTTGLPTLISFVCRADGRLLSGEPLAAAVQAVLQFQPCAVLVNCTAAPDVTPLLHILKENVGSIPFGAYANTGRLTEDGQWQETDAVNPQRYAEYAEQWIQQGARLVGGCCGTTPGHIRQLKQKLKSLTL